MAISNPVTIGSATPAVGSAASIAITTSASVPAGGKIWATVGWFGATTLSSVTSSPALTWTVDSTVTNGSNHEAIAWADAPSGLVSGSTITANFSAASTSRYAQGMYSTGVATGVATQRTSGTTGTTAWTSGALTVPNGSILIGADYGGSTNATNTASGGNTEVHDESLATDSCTTTCYQLGTGASIASSGTWTTSEANSAIGVQFDAASTASASPMSARPLLPTLHKFSPLRTPGFPAPQVPTTAATGPFNYTQDLTAGLSFTGSQSKQTTDAGFAATLSFAGAFVKRTIGAGFTATLSFLGALTTLKMFNKALTATLSFTGAFVKSTSRAMTATLGFAGAFVKAVREATYSATLSFTGALTKRSPRAFTATLSFTGAIATLKAFGKALTATLSFTGAFVKLPTKALTATLSFTGAFKRATVHALPATLSFAGSLVKRTARALTATLSFTGAMAASKSFLKALPATLSFTGSLASQKLLNKALTATLSFTGSMTRRTGKSLTATLSFAGSMPRRIGRALGAALGFLGSLVPTKQGGGGEPLTVTASDAVLNACVLADTALNSATLTEAALSADTISAVAAASVTTSDASLNPLTVTDGVF